MASAVLSGSPFRLRGICLPMPGPLQIATEKVFRTSISQARKRWTSDSSAGLDAGLYAFCPATWTAPFPCSASSPMLWHAISCRSDTHTLRGRLFHGNILSSSGFGHSSRYPRPVRFRAVKSTLTPLPFRIPSPAAGSPLPPSVQTPAGFPPAICSDP